MTKVSVIIPTYNRACLLERAAVSVLQQTWMDLELIIVDDGSHDRTHDVCTRLCEQDRRVHYVFQDNSGPNAARNNGVRHASGEYVAFLDSDDLWESSKLAKQLAVAENNPAVGVVYCDYACMDDTGRTWPAVYCEEVGQTMYESLLYYNVVWGSASAALVRAVCFDHVGLFDESLHRAEDWEMWLRIAAHYQFAKVPEVLVYLLQHPEQSQRNNQGMADSQLALMEKISVSMPARYRHHLARVRWHYGLIAAELYCATNRRKSWRAMAIAINSWPPGLSSPRTWYVLALSLTGPFYPQANTCGLALRRWLRCHMKLGSVTGGRGQLTRSGVAEQ